MLIHSSSLKEPVSKNVSKLWFSLISDSSGCGNRIKLMIHLIRLNLWFFLKSDWSRFGSRFKLIRNLRSVLVVYCPGLTSLTLSLPWFSCTCISGTPGESHTTGAKTAEVREQSAPIFRTTNHIPWLSRGTERTCTGTGRLLHGSKISVRQQSAQSGTYQWGYTSCEE